MVSIKALIASTLFASAIGGPVSADFHECTISVAKNYGSFNLTTFSGVEEKLPINSYMTEEVLFTDLGDKTYFDVTFRFDSTKDHVVQSVTVDHQVRNEFATVEAVKGILGYEVTTTRLNGLWTKTFFPGTHSVLDGLVKYTVRTSLTESSITFVVNNDITIHVIDWEAVPSGKPTISIKQPTYYDLPPRRTHDGQCVGVL